MPKAQTKNVEGRLWVNRRHGYYAARCNRPGNAIYRANRTGRIYASPTNLPEISHHHGIWRQQNSPPRAIIPANQPNGQTPRASNARPYNQRENCHKIKMCPQSGHTLFIIFYLQTPCDFCANSTKIVEHFCTPVTEYSAK